MIKEKFFLGILIVLFALSCQRDTTKKLTIATSANLQFAMKELVDNFTEISSIPCEIVVGSSGKLTAQISAGAPYDVFVSANMLYPTRLFENELTTAPPKIYAQGKLVLWTMQEQIELTLDNLENEKIKHIALANPKTAPYGKAAVEYLLITDLFGKIESKIVYGESIAQVNQFVNSQVVDMGFTAKSVVLSPQMKGKGSWMEIPEELYTPIAQGIVLLKNEAGKETQAQQFSDFLFSAQGEKILEDFGYSTE